MIIHKRWERLVVTVLTVVILSGIISFAMLAIQAGFQPHFIAHWLNAWLIAFCVALPAVWVVPGFVKRVLDKAPIEFK
ncbi:DUF2798 domain-containing protein [Pasteurellaceae bacterium TAE3-ERU1]|nr:DUF2798 domain-containing protein [Pasteurellaceae bacterium TAE3-ERU1]